MFKLRYMAIGLASAVFGAALAIGVFMYYVPLPKDAMARADGFGADRRAWLHQSMGELFPTRTVDRAGDTAPLPKADGRLEGFTFTFEGESLAIDDLFTTQETLGLVIVKDGALVHEAYADGAGPATLFTTWSVVKSFTSTLVGLAVADGLIADVDQPLTRYLPELQGTAYDGVSIRQALEMSSGVRFDVDGGGDTRALIADGPVTAKRPAFEIAASYQRAAEPGTVFNYNTAETQILVELVRRVTGEPAADYMSRKLWQPLGMEFNGAWVLDAAGEDGAEMGGAMFNASLRDWTRFGWFMAQDGVWNGQRLLPEGWVAAATTSDAPHLTHGEVHPDTTLGYGWQWWTRADGSFLASGAYGQLILIDPAAGLVVAKASAWETPRQLRHGAETTAMARAVAAYLEEGDGVDLTEIDVASVEGTGASEIPPDPQPETLEPQAPQSVAAESTPPAPVVTAPVEAPSTPPAGPDAPPPSMKPDIEPLATVADIEDAPRQAAPVEDNTEDGMGVAESRFITPDE